MFGFVGRAGTHAFVFLMLFFVLFCILCGRVRACNCYASYPLVNCVCLPSGCVCKLYRQCVYWWVLCSEGKRTLCLRLIVSSPLSCSL